MDDTLSRHLAQNLIALRNSRRLSQQRLAAAAELPRSTLAQMESGSGNPALATLMAVARALGVGLDELVAPPRSDSLLLRAAEIPSRQRDGVTIHDLLPERVRGLEIIRIEISAGASMNGTPHLPGTKEYLHGLKGCISVLTSGQLHAVNAGDVLAFAGHQAHSYLNRGSRKAEAISVVVPLPVQQPAVTAPAGATDQSQAASQPPASPPPAKRHAHPEPR